SPPSPRRPRSSPRRRAPRSRPAPPRGGTYRPRRSAPRRPQPENAPAAPFFPGGRNPRFQTLKGQTMRHLLATAAACALTAVSIVTAHAHATLEKAEAAPGSYKAVIRIPHGCDGQPTETVRVEVPEGYIGVKPQPKA